MFFCHVLNRANWKFNYTLCNYVTRIYIVSCVVDKAYFLVYIHTSTLRRVMHRNQMVKLLANECSGFNPGSSSFPCNCMYSWRIQLSLRNVVLAYDSLANVAIDLFDPETQLDTPAWQTKRRIGSCQSVYQSSFSFLRL